MGRNGGDCVFCLNAELTLGLPKKFRIRDFTMQDFRPCKMTANVPVANMVRLESVQVDATEILCDPVTGRSMGIDAFALSPETRAPLEGLFSPRLWLECKHGAVMDGTYSGLVPHGMIPGSSYLFSLGIEGRRFGWSVTG